MTSRATTLTLLVLLAVVVIAVALYERSNLRADLEAEWRTADRWSDGHCFICGRRLNNGDDVGSYDDDPARGIAHFACIEAREGPLTEVR